MTYRPSKFTFVIIFVSDEVRAKTPQKPNYESKEVRILEENGVTSKLKHRKAHNLILSGRFGYPYKIKDWWERPWLPDNAGELACMENKMKEIQEKSILFRVSEGSSYRESTVSSYRSVKHEHVMNGVFFFSCFKLWKKKPITCK